MLNEDNKSILDLVNYIDQKIITIREENQYPPKVISSLSSLHSNTVGKWMGENYITNIESDSNEEEIIMNKLLELIDFINKL